MEIIKQDFRKGYARIKITDLEDLWHLSQVILPGDLIQGRSVRKVKVGSSEEKQAVSKKTIIVKIDVEKISFDKGLESLRLNGKVVNEIEDVPRGSYHSLDISVGDMIDIEKEEFLDYQIKYLKEASSGKKAKILMVVLDREEASFGLVKAHGIEMLSEISGTAEKKYVKEKISKEFYSDVISQIQDYDKRFNFESILIGSPAFWKDEIYKKLTAELRKKVILANCNHVGKSGMNELLKRDEVKKALAESRISMESNIIEKLLLEISKNEKAVYGFSETKDAVYSGAVEVLVISTQFISSHIENNGYKTVNDLMKTAEKNNGAVRIINSDNEPGQKLDGLGGVAGILRYKLNY
jgi:protein pelota